MYPIHHLDTDAHLSDEHERLAVTAFHADGERMPMVFVRSWFGELPAYQRLAQQLGSEQPLYTIAPPQGSDPAEYPQNVDSWARWIAERCQELHGDCIVGGNSFGGVLALHLTTALASNQGEPRLRPRYVVLIDTSLPRRSNFQPKSRTHWVLHNLNKVAAMPRGERSEFVKSRVRQRWAQQRKKRSGRSQQRDPQATTVVTSTGEKMPLLQRTIWVSYLKYQPQLWDLPISLLWTDESREKAGDALLNWAPWLMGPVHAQRIDGAHYTLMTPQHIGSLTERLRSAQALAHSAAPEHVSHNPLNQ